MISYDNDGTLFCCLDFRLRKVLFGVFENFSRNYTFYDSIYDMRWTWISNVSDLRTFNIL